MRQIDKAMCEAIKARKNWKSGNTRVTIFNTQWGVNYKVELHGHPIYFYSEAEDIATFTLAGWDTLTTRTRLRALGVDLERKNGKTMYNGNEIISNVSYVVR